MRRNFVPILESWGADLVLAGHSHSYERSFLIDGHYAASTIPSTSLSKKMAAPDGALRRTSSPPARSRAQGAVYTVAGSSGQISGGSLNHPAMFISLNVLGSLVLDFETNRLDVSFLKFQRRGPGYVRYD